FCRGFVILAPGIINKVRLRVLLRANSENYYRTRVLVPPEMLTELGNAKVVVTNYHAFQLRNELQVGPVAERLLQGRTGSKIEKKETEGQMLQRACGELLSLRNIVVINDEAHHCYRERPGADAEKDAEAKENREAARLWISGIEALKRKTGLRAVYDLSATP